MHEAWPKAHHQAPPDLAIRQRQLCSGARPSAQPKSLLATRSESLPITSRARNERNANTEVLDFMHGWMTNRHEGYVSTMPTGSNFSIALSVRHFKGLYDEMGDARRKARHFGVLSVLTSHAYRVADASPSVRQQISPVHGRGREASFLHPKGTKTRLHLEGNLQDLREKKGRVDTMSVGTRDRTTPRRGELEATGRGGGTAAQHGTCAQAMEKDA